MDDIKEILKHAENTYQWNENRLICKSDTKVMADVR